MYTCCSRKDLIHGQYFDGEGKRPIFHGRVGNCRIVYSCRKCPFDRPDINFAQRILTVQHSKSGKPRYIPLSDYALEWLGSLVRVIDCPYVFVRLDSRDRWRKPDGLFAEGRKAAGLEWVGFHDLRHFRATQWVMRGVDLRTVQELLGHSTITTTMRYAHFAASHATRAVRESQKAEAAALGERAKSGRKNS